MIDIANGWITIAGNQRCLALRSSLETPRMGDRPLNRHFTKLVKTISVLSVVVASTFTHRDASANSLQFSVTDLGSVDSYGIQTRDPTLYGAWHYVPSSAYPGTGPRYYLRVLDKTSFGDSLIQAAGYAPYRSIHTFIGVNSGATNNDQPMHSYDIGTIGGYDEVIAADWNSTQNIVGTMDADEGGRTHEGTGSFRAFLDYDGMHDLNTMISADSGWLLKSAITIDDKLNIFGWGVNPQGEIHAFSLAPITVPEPSSGLLLGGSLLVLALRKKLSRGLLFSS